MSYIEKRIVTKKGVIVGKYYCSESKRKPARKMGRVENRKGGGR